MRSMKEGIRTVNPVWSCMGGSRVKGGLEGERRSPEHWHRREERGGRGRRSIAKESESIRGGG